MSSSSVKGGLGHPSTHPNISSEEPSAESSTNPTRLSSPGGDNPHPQKRGRVRFNSTSEANDAANKRSSFPLRDRSLSPTAGIITSPQQTKTSPAHSRNSSITSVFRRAPEKETDYLYEDLDSNAAFKPRSSFLRSNSKKFAKELDDVQEFSEKDFSALAAQERAQRIASLIGSHSAPASRSASFEEEEDFIRQRAGSHGYPVRIDDIPLIDMDSKRTYDGVDDSEEENVEISREKGKASTTSEAHKLVRSHTRKNYVESLAGPSRPAPGVVSGQVTPVGEKHDVDYVPRPQHYRGGVLSSLLKLYNAPQPNRSDHSRQESDTSFGSLSHTGTTTVSAGSSGTNTPRRNTKWYSQKNQSHDTLAGLIEASNMLATQGGVNPGKHGLTRPGAGKRSHSERLLDSARRFSGRPRLEDEIRITVHIAETLSRQKYLLKLCWALMSYGAPTHRLEEYMKMSARVLEIDGQFLYMPGCMIISFDDVSTHTTEVKLVRMSSTQGVDLGKLKDVHEIYKEVVHDVVGVEEATQKLDELTSIKKKHGAWMRVFVYGCASATVGPFAFEARLIDIPICFFLGSLLGFLQLVVAPRSELYTNVFEITAAVVTSFLARAFGSIQNGNLFCFPALAQSSIALILPGYLVLCGSLELQSRSMVAGSIRMVYAIIYSLFLGFGITIGTAFYGIMDANATSATTCADPISQYYKWIFVPLFTLCLCVINQAKWKQIPVMLIIAMNGYIVNFFSAKKFPSSAQISNALGAFAVGVQGNMYSRLRHGVAAAAILPAIFVQVPSGIAASGSLLAGISSADKITNTTTYANGTSKIDFNSTGVGGGFSLFKPPSGNNMHPFVLPLVISITSAEDLNTIVFNVGYSMIQVAIGITVGLFLSALVVYPFGKRRSGLFSF